MNIPALSQLNPAVVDSLGLAWQLNPGIPTDAIMRSYAQKLNIDFSVIRYWFWCRAHFMQIRQAFERVADQEKSRVIEFPSLENYHHLAMFSVPGSRYHTQVFLHETQMGKKDVEKPFPQTKREKAPPIDRRTESRLSQPSSAARTRLRIRSQPVAKPDPEQGSETPPPQGSIQSDAEALKNRSPSAVASSPAATVQPSLSVSSSSLSLMASSALNDARDDQCERIADTDPRSNAKPTKNFQRLMENGILARPSMNWTISAPETLQDASTTTAKCQKRKPLLSESSDDDNSDGPLTGHEERQLNVTSSSNPQASKSSNSIRTPPDSHQNDKARSNTVHTGDREVNFVSSKQLVSNSSEPIPASSSRLTSQGDDRSSRILLEAVLIGERQQDGKIEKKSKRAKISTTTRTIAPSTIDGRKRPGRSSDNATKQNVDGSVEQYIQYLTTGTNDNPSVRPAKAHPDAAKAQPPMLRLSMSKLRQPYQESPVTMKDEEEPSLGTPTVYEHVIPATPSPATTKATLTGDGSTVELECVNMESPSLPVFPFGDPKAGERAYEAFQKNLLENRRLLKAPNTARSSGLTKPTATSTSNSPAIMRSSASMTPQSQSSPDSIGLRRSNRLLCTSESDQYKEEVVQEEVMDQGSFRSTSQIPWTVEFEGVKAKKRPKEERLTREPVRDSHLNSPTIPSVISPATSPEPFSKAVNSLRTLDMLSPLEVSLEDPCLTSADIPTVSSPTIASGVNSPRLSEVDPRATSELDKDRLIQQLQQRVRELETFSIDRGSGSSDRNGAHPWQHKMPALNRNPTPADMQGSESRWGPSEIKDEHGCHGQYPGWSTRGNRDSHGDARAGLGGPPEEFSGRLGRGLGRGWGAQQTQCLDYSGEDARYQTGPPRKQVDYTDLNAPVFSTVVTGSVPQPYYASGPKEEHFGGDSGYGGGGSIHGDNGFEDSQSGFSSFSNMGYNHSSNGAAGSGCGGTGWRNNYSSTSHQETSYHGGCLGGEGSYGGNRGRGRGRGESFRGGRGGDGRGDREGYSRGDREGYSRGDREGYSRGDKGGFQGGEWDGRGRGRGRPRGRGLGNDRAGRGQGYGRDNCSSDRGNGCGGYHESGNKYSWSQNFRDASDVASSSTGSYEGDDTSNTSWRHPTRHQTSVGSFKQEELPPTWGQSTSAEVQGGSYSYGQDQYGQPHQVQQPHAPFAGDNNSMLASQGSMPSSEAKPAWSACMAPQDPNSSPEVLSPEMPASPNPRPASPSRVESVELPVTANSFLDSVRAPSLSPSASPLPLPLHQPSSSGLLSTNPPLQQDQIASARKFFVTRSPNFQLVMEEQKQQQEGRVENTGGTSDADANAGADPSKASSGRN